MSRGAALVLYDEGCAFCTEAARFFEQYGVRVEPIGSPLGAFWLRDLSPAERYAAFHAIDGLGRRLSAGNALPLVLERLPGGRALALLARLAQPLTNLGYSLVASNRSALSRAFRRASRGRAG